MGKTPEIWQSFLFAWMFWAGLSLGCLGLLLLHNAVKGRWGLTVLRVWEAGAKQVWIWLIILIGAFAFGGLKAAYPWDNPSLLNKAYDPIVKHKQAYLNDPGFLIRAVVVLVIFTALMIVLTNSSARQERTGNAREVDFRSNIAAPGGVIFILLMTMGLTDWFMSLDAHYYSTIFPLQVMMGECISAAAFTALYIWSKFGKPPYTQELITTKVRNDIGNLILMFTMIWAYFSISQFLIQWSGNLPDEIHYYYVRNTMGWLPIGTIVVIFQFFVPFTLLVSGRTKQTPAYLGLTALMVMIVRMLDVFWITRPMFARDFAFYATDVLLFVVFGAIWLGAFFFALGRTSPIPRFVPVPSTEALEHA